jgi:hypothetical protein
MSKSYVNTAAANDATALLLVQMDALISAYASLKASHAAMAAKLNLDTGVTDTNYADSSSAAPSTTASQFLGS